MRRPQTPQCSGDPRSITAAPCPRAARLAQEQQLLPARRHQSPTARLLLNAGSRTRPRETQDAPQRQLDQKQADECKSTGFLSPFTPTGAGQPRYVTPPCRAGLTKAEQEGAQSCVLLKAALFLQPPPKAIEVNERFFVASSRLERQPFSSAASCLGNNPGVVHGGIIKASF